MVEFNDYLYCAKIHTAHCSDLLAGKSMFLEPSEVEGLSVGRFLEEQGWQYDDLVKCDLHCYANTFCEVFVLLCTYNGDAMQEFSFICKFSVGEFYTDVLQKLL